MWRQCTTSACRRVWSSSSFGAGGPECLAAALRRLGRRPVRDRPRGPRARLLQPLARQFIGSFVESMAGVTFDPMPTHPMLRQRGIEPLPEIDVLRRLLVGGAPAVALPLVDP